MELVMNGITVLCLMILIFLEIMEMEEKKKNKPESKEEIIQSEFEKLMSYSEQDAINSKKR